MMSKKLNISLAKLSRCLFLLAVVPFVIAENLPYITTAEKTVAGYRATDSSSFTIPSNQCSGFIDESLLCGRGGVPGSVRVVVKESTTFPSVHINRQLRNVTIMRGRDAWGACAGPAVVDVFVGCLVAAPASHQRRRRSVRALPSAIDLMLID